MYGSPIPTPFRTVILEDKDPVEVRPSCDVRCQSGAAFLLEETTYSLTMTDSGRSE